MINIDEDIRDEIKNLESLIDNAENTDPAFLNNWLRQLRHRVFYIHSAIENGIEILIAKDIIPDITDPKSNEEAENLFAHRIKLYTLLQHLTFSRKLTFAFDRKLIPSNIKGKFQTINAIRNEFAHPDTYKIKRYTDYKLTKDTLEKLVDGHEALQNLFKSSHYSP